MLAPHVRKEHVWDAHHQISNMHVYACTYMYMRIYIVPYPYGLTRYKQGVEEVDVQAYQLYFFDKACMLRHTW